MARAAILLAALLAGAGRVEALEIAAYPKPLHALVAMVTGQSGVVALLPGAQRLVPAEGLGTAPDIIFLAGPESGARELAASLAPPAGIVDFAPDAVWLDTEFSMLIALDIADQLAPHDPVNASLYHRNAERAVDAIDALDKEIVALLKPVRDKTFMTFGLQDGSFEHRFELVSAGHLTLAPEHRRHLGGVAGTHLAPLRAAIRDSGGRCVIGKGAPDLPLLQLIVDETPARAVWLDIEGAALPPGTNTYVETLRRVAQAYRDCLAE
jgi:zinc transport system substrate-binding protein